MNGQLHLLRGFVQWSDRRTGEPITSIEAADSWVNYIASCGFDVFYTWTSRRITRADELKGGSVFFVGGPGRDMALFRMPCIGVEEDNPGWAICMKPRLIMVQPRVVGRVRGWRYLDAKSAPSDLLAAGRTATGLPHNLRETGLV